MFFIPEILNMCCFVPLMNMVAGTQGLPFKAASTKLLRAILRDWASLCFSNNGRQFGTTSFDEAKGRFDQQTRRTTLTSLPCTPHVIGQAPIPSALTGIKKLHFDRSLAHLLPSSCLMKAWLPPSDSLVFPEPGVNLRSLSSPKPEKSRSPALLRFFLSAPGGRIGYSICRTVFPPRYSKSKLAFNGTPRGDVVPDYSASTTSSTSDRAVSNSNNDRRLSG